MANPSLFYCLRFVFRTFLLNFQGCHCSIIKVHLFVCAVHCSRRLCYFSTSLCACQVLFLIFFEALSNFLSRTRLCCFVSFAATLIFYQSFSGLSSTFFIFLFPSPDRLDDSLTACISQAPLFLRFRRNSWYDTTVVRICQQFFSKFLKFFLRSQNFRVYYFYIYNSSNMFNPILSLYKKQEHTENTVSNTLLLSELYFFAII